MTKIKTISVLGPTASGKTALSIALAKRLDGEIISCRVRLPAFVWAPVREGETIGMITYMVGERVVGKAAIKAAVEVAARPKQSFSKKWRLACRQLFTEWLR